ncbi:MAG: hypothetical protein ACN6I7_02510 [bacterium]
MRGWLWVAGLTVLVLGAVGLYVALNANALIGRAIESYGSRYLGAPVSVAGVDVAVTEGSAGLRALEVGNPEPYSGPPAIALGSIAIVLDAARTSSELIVLRQVTIDGATVAIQERGGETNLQRLLANLEAATGAEAQAEQTGVGSEVKLIIERFSLTGASATLSSELLGEGAVEIADVLLTDIGTADNGASVGEVLEQILRPIVRSATRELASRGVDLDGAREQIEQRLRDRVQGGIDSITEGLRSNP